MKDRTGQQLGNYRLTRLLGRGGFADVYLGQHIHLDTHQAAIKVLHTQLASEDMERFRVEARRLAHLIHPHIVRLLDYHIEGDTPFVVMEHAPNGTLRQFYPRGTKLPLSTVISYVTQLADALQYTHDEKLIHRDVKPGNLLLGRKNEILLSDFGIAVLTLSARTHSTENKVAGTAEYMAPEQLQGRPHPASDQYALGIVVYEWLSGDVPFHGSFFQLVTQHLLTLPPPLRERGFAPLPEVEQAVMRALAKEPKDRFASVQEFAQALVTALQQAIQLASEPTVKDEHPAFAIPLQVRATPQRKLSPASLKTKEQWFIKGSTHQSARQYREAIAAYNLAIELDPTYASAYARRGQVYSLLKDYFRAVKDFDRALTLDPGLSWVKPDREYAYRQLNGFK